MSGSNISVHGLVPLSVDGFDVRFVGQHWSFSSRVLPSFIAQNAHVVDTKGIMGLDEPHVSPLIE